MSDEQSRASDVRRYDRLWHKTKQSGTSIRSPLGVGS